MKGWFEVDDAGLTKLLEAKGKHIAFLELLGNAWDADGVTTVNINISPAFGMPKVYVNIEDDSPVGFTKLDHAWTLFAASNRKGDRKKRGRFNFGEKLVLSLCDEAEIATTTGTVVFNEKGRRHYPSRRRERGSVFTATMNVTRDELAEAEYVLRSVIPPKGVCTFFNEEEIVREDERGCLITEPLMSIETNLPTEYADDNGVLRKSRTNTVIEVWSVQKNEMAHIYEMGVPIVATGDRWHYNILQKVPLGFNRDNVTPSYLQEVRTAVLNHTYGLLSKEDVDQRWVTNALEDSEVMQEAMHHVITTRFGGKAVVYDPSDTEANNRATMEGYTVIPGGSLSAAAWRNVRASQVVLPAGKVTPTPQPFSDEGRPLTYVDEAKYTEAQWAYAEYARFVASRILGIPDLIVHLTTELRWKVTACFTHKGRELIVNLRRTDIKNRRTVNALLLHEYAHHRVVNHLSEDYHDEMARLGAELAELAATQPVEFWLIQPDRDDG